MSSEQGEAGGPELEGQSPHKRQVSTDDIYAAGGIPKEGAPEWYKALVEEVVNELGNS